MRVGTNVGPPVTSRDATAGANGLRGCSKNQARWTAPIGKGESWQRNYGAHRLDCLDTEVYGINRLDIVTWADTHLSPRPQNRRTTRYNRIEVREALHLVAPELTADVLQSTAVARPRRLHAWTLSSYTPGCCS